MVNMTSNYWNYKFIFAFCAIIGMIYCSFKTGFCDFDAAVFICGAFADFSAASGSVFMQAETPKGALCIHAGIRKGADAVHIAP